MKRVLKMVLAAVFVFSVYTAVAWAGAEVSHDPRYYNVCLVKHPYKEWRD